MNHTSTAAMACAHLSSVQDPWPAYMWNDLRSSSEIPSSSADLDDGVGNEFKLGNRKVFGRRSFANAPGRIVVRTVARTEPAARNRRPDPAAHSPDGCRSRPSRSSFPCPRQPSAPYPSPAHRSPDWRVAGNPVFQVIKHDAARLLDFRLGAVADEYGLATPLDRNRHSRLDGRNINLDRGESQRSWRQVSVGR